jgi:hypothetical protein
MIPEIYDDPKNDGIILVLDMENGMAISIFMTDEAAEQMCDVIRNKLNARR